jgi:hypothetical protein
MRLSRTRVSGYFHMIGWLLTDVWLISRQQQRSYTSRRCPTRQAHEFLPQVWRTPTLDAAAQRRSHRVAPIREWPDQLAVLAQWDQLLDRERYEEADLHDWERYWMVDMRDGAFDFRWYLGRGPARS